MVIEIQIDVESKQLALIRKILKRHIAYKTVWAYGSRVNWTADQYSDLDLVVFEVNTVKLGELKEDFTESDLPFSVDIILWEKIPEHFKNKILEKYVVLQKKPELEGWKECRLGDVATKIGSGATPRGGSNAYKGFGVSLIRSQNVLDFEFSRSGLVFIDDSQANGLKNVEIQENDVLLNITGDSVARCCIVPNNTLPARVNQHVSIIRLNPELADYKLVFYSLQYLKDELLMQAEIGATRKALTKGMVENLEIFLPPLSEQKTISSVLSCLDDKIDLLHRQNKTLEAMEETLFRQWFVEEAKEDWVEKVITEFFEIRDGTHDSPKQNPIGKPLLTSKHICTNRLDIENAYLISEEDFANVNKRSKVDTNDILFSMIGTIGLTYLEQSETIDYAIKNIGLFKTSQNPEWRYYTYLWLSSSLGKEFVHEHRSGSTQEYISLGSLRSIIFDTPPTEKLDDFNTNIQPYFEKIKTNLDQIYTLEKLRDTLLPKLMSGEVRMGF